MAGTTHGSRIEQLTSAAALLLFPVIMNQVGREWTWSVALVAGFAIGGLLLLIELLGRKSTEPAYRAGVTTALAASFLLTWINLVASLTGVEGNPADVGFFTLVLAAGVGAFAARGRPEGMARAMLGVAVVQAILGALAATDPTSAGSESRILVLTGYFTALWLTSAAAFWRSARQAGAVQAES